MTNIISVVQELIRSQSSENIYNITPDTAKGSFTIISQVGAYCVQVSVTMTSASTREDPTPEQAKGMCLADKLPC